MANYDMLTKLLDLPNVRVTHYQLVGRQRLNLFIESTVAAAVCPDCQHLSLAVHQIGEPQMLRDLPIWNRRCWLGYAPRRFKCESCATTFVERVGWRESGLDYTARYAQFVYERTRREPLAQIAHAEELTEAIVQGIFERGAKKHSPSAATRL
ncbi:MAG TPA: transposase family protein [Pyrinomonadaceae bacterium]|nr:transposase family protein [Pyrinomonadaceae bacterium]